MGNDDWFARSFARDYLRIYRHRTSSEAAHTLDKLLGLVTLAAPACCLDLCCGFGRHLRELRRRGLDAYGLDLSDTLLAEAAEDPLMRGRLVRGDMRALPFGSRFDAVFSFFTSFGYFLDDAENAGVISEIARVLRPGGRFLIDFLNAGRERRDLLPLDIRFEADFQLTQRRWIDAATNTLHKQLRMEDAAGTRTYRERVKLYGPTDFQRFCEGAGLRVDGLLGSADGEAWTPGAPRLIVLGHKPPRPQGPT